MLFTLFVFQLPLTLPSQRGMFSIGNDAHTAMKLAHDAGGSG